jgi:ketosteroid isomerase-like protein
MYTSRPSYTLRACAAYLLFTVTVASPIPAKADMSAETLQLIDASQRSTPADLLALLGRLMEARDLDAIIAIHEDEAAMVKWGGGVARGEDAIRQVYVDFFATDPVLKVQALQIVEAGNTAIILGDYTMDYTNANGKIISVEGKFGDMVRQQRDGSWLYLLDNPFAP